MNDARRWSARTRWIFTIVAAFLLLAILIVILPPREPAEEAAPILEPIEETDGR